MVDNNEKPILSESARQATITDDLADQSHHPNNINEFEEYAQDTFDGSGHALNTQDGREQYEENNRASNPENNSDWLDLDEQEVDVSDWLDLDEQDADEQDYTSFLENQQIESEIDYQNWVQGKDGEEDVISDERLEPVSPVEESVIINPAEDVSHLDQGRISPIIPRANPSHQHGSTAGHVAYDAARYFEPGQFDQQSGVSVGANVLKAGINVALMIDGLANRDPVEDEDKERLANLLTGIQKAGERFQQLEERANAINQDDQALSDEDKERLLSVVEATTEAKQRTDSVDERATGVEDVVTDFWDDPPDEPIRQTQPVQEPEFSHDPYEEEIVGAEVSSNDVTATINYMGEKLGEEKPLIDKNASFSEQLSQAEEALKVINRRLDKLEARLDALEAKLETGEDIEKHQEITNDFANSFSELVENHGELTDSGYLEIETKSGGTIKSPSGGGLLEVTTSGLESFIASKDINLETWVPTHDDFSDEFKQQLTNWAVQKNQAFYDSKANEMTSSRDESQL